MSGAASAASYATRLQTLRVALHAASRERLVLSSPTEPSSAISLLEPLYSQLYSAWEGLKAFEEARAAEESEMYKTKVKTTVIGTVEEDDEADFRRRNLDPWTLFDDLVPDDEGPPDDVRKMAEEKEKEKMVLALAVEETSESQARSTAAKNLLEGELLEDIVAAHSSSSAAAVASRNVLRRTEDRSEAASGGTARWVGPRGVARSFELSHDLGAQLLKWIGLCLPASVDESSADGHLFRACLMHRQIARAPASTAQDAAAPLASKVPRGRKAAEALEAKRQLEEEDWLGLYSSEGMSSGEGGVDIHDTCVEELCLLQAPVSTVESRLHALLVGKFNPCYKEVWGTPAS